MSVLLLAGWRFCLAQQPSKKHRRQYGCDQLGCNESWYVRGCNSGKTIRKSSCYGHRRVCKGCRGGKPIGCGDIKPDRHGKCSGAERYANEDCANQAEGGNEFTDPLAKPAAHGCRGVNQGMIKHHMRGKNTQNSAKDLGAYVKQRLLPFHLTAQPKANRNRRVELCA